MFVLVMSQKSLIMVIVRSKIRSLDEILEKPFVHCRGHIFGPILMKLGQNVCLIDISKVFDDG